MKTEKTIRLTFLSLFINLSFALYNTALGFISHSWWFITISAYYAVLSVIRFAVLQFGRKAKSNPDTEAFAKRFTGVMLMVLSLCLVGTVIMCIFTDRAIRYHQIIMISIAAYTFTKITLAIINLIKAKSSDSPIIKTLRSISLADAFVSVFSLQRSMLRSFEGMSEENILLMNTLTGSVVCLIIFVLGLNLTEWSKIIMAKSKIVNVNKKIADAVVDGYKKIEVGVVKGYTKIEDKFIDRYLTKEGETVEDAKKRLKENNK